jgi:hypothetical protein
MQSLVEAKDHRRAVRVLGKSMQTALERRSELWRELLVKAVLQLRAFAVKRGVEEEILSDI